MKTIILIFSMLISLSGCNDDNTDCNDANAYYSDDSTNKQETSIIGTWQLIEAKFYGEKESTSSVGSIYYSESIYYCDDNITYTTIINRDITPPPPPTPCDTLTFNGESFSIINPCESGSSSSSGAYSNENFSIDNNTIKRVVIYDITGRRIKEFLSESINISNLSSGIYIAKVELASGKILTKKIIK